MTPSGDSLVDGSSGAPLGSAVSELEAELRELLVSALQLEDVSAEEIDVDAPLFGEGLGLDSIDALELAVALAKKYGVNIKAEEEASRASFASVRALAGFVAEHRSA